MRFSHRLFLLLILLLTGAPILAQEPSDVAKNVRMMVSGIVSYTRWPALSGPPKLCIFSSSRFSTALQENAATSLPYLPVGNDSNLLIVFYVQIMPDDFVMQLHRF